MHMAQWPMHMLYTLYIRLLVAQQFTLLAKHVCKQLYKGRQERLSWVLYDPARPRSWIPLLLS